MARALAAISCGLPAASLALRPPDSFRRHATLQAMLTKGILVTMLSVISACSSQAVAPTEAVRSGGTAGQTAPSTAAPSSEGATIVKLRLRDVDLSIESTREGPSFALAAPDGVVLERGLDAAELRARHPDLYRVVQSAVV